MKCGIVESYKRTKPRVERCNPQLKCLSGERAGYTHGPSQGSAALLVRYHAVSFWRARKSVERPSLPPEMMPSQRGEFPIILLGAGYPKIAEVSNYGT